jgi:hypothetical protein
VTENGQRQSKKSLMTLTPDPRAFQVRPCPRLCRHRRRPSRPNRPQPPGVAFPGGHYCRLHPPHHGHLLGHRLQAQSLQVSQKFIFDLSIFLPIPMKLLVIILR